MSKELISKLKLPAILLAILFLPLMFGKVIPMEVKAFSYALSLSMKAILEFVLPFIIFSFVFSCLANFQKGAIFFVALLVITIFMSNFTALMFGYTSGYIGLNLLHFTPSAIESAPQLLPTWQVHLKKLLSNDSALLIGFFIGIFFSLRPNRHAKALGTCLNKLSTFFLKRLFVPILPIFILGFLFKLEHEQLLKTALTHYGPILLLIVFSQWLYLLIWYTVASQFSWKKLGFYLRNVLPATLTGLSTISSAASMPVLLIATEKNLQCSQRANMLVPAIINIHTVGSAIGIPILTLATLLTFNFPLPSVHDFIIFAFYTALAKYAVAAVPGGVIIVVAPILEAHLGFSGDMVGLITAIYLICDPFGTAANVTGNGVFPILFDKVYKKLAQVGLANNAESNKLIA